jgi:hypothetical protein
MRQINQKNPDLPSVDGETVAYAGPRRDFSGAYLFARYQLTRRMYLGGRYDWLQDSGLDGRILQAGSGYLEFFPSEFSKLIAGFEHVYRPGADASFPQLGSDRHVNRILLQASFALGPHKPHPF